MSRDEGDVVRLLIDTGILSEEDARSLQTAQSEVLLALMIERRALQPSEAEEARVFLNDILGNVNRMRKLHSSSKLLSLITTNLHRRMSTAGDTVRREKERITGATFPVVAVALKPTNGD